MKKRWSKIRPDEVVELGGRDWTVEKVKPKGKSLRVVVRSGSHRAEAKVDPDAKVRIAEKKNPRQSGGRAGSNPTSVPRPSATPPAPAVGDPWETQQDRIERKLGEIGARLVGEATDERAGYYVPPVDLTTVAAHARIFHGEIPEEYRDDEAALLDWHEREHAAALSGDRAFATNHWHTEQRPTTGKKGKKR